MAVQSCQLKFLINLLADHAGQVVSSLPAAQAPVLTTKELFELELARPSFSWRPRGKWVGISLDLEPQVGIGHWTFWWSQIKSIQG